MNKPIRCAVIGQNPMRFPWGFDEEDKFCSKMKTELAQQIMVLRQRGVSQFLTACDCGVGLYAGEIINGLRTTDRDLMLIATYHMRSRLQNGRPTCGNATLLCWRNAPLSPLCARSVCRTRSSKPTRRSSALQMWC